MTKEEAIKYLEKRKEKALMLMEESKADTPINNKVRGILTRKIEVLDMAISALSEELSEDGTLTVHVSDGSKVNRVFVMGDNIFGGLYYPDFKNKGKWEKIWRTDCMCLEYVCSKCGNGEDYQTDFCPNCGADMRGE